MDKFDKAINIGLASAFGAAGSAALTGALFFGATHQFAMAGICTIVTTALISEIRREKKTNKPINHTTMIRKWIKRLLAPMMREAVRAELKDMSESLVKSLSKINFSLHQETAANDHCQSEKIDHDS